MEPHTAATAATAATVTTTIDTDARSSTNLVVSHLSRYVNDEALKSAFAPFGSIVASKVMYDIHSGVSKGMGFVRFATHEEAQAALTAMHHTVLRKSKIAVRWAKEKHDEAPTGAARREMRELFIRNVPLDVVAEDVAVLASRYGTVLHAWLCSDTHANPVDPRRIAFVTFAEDGAAERALSGLHRRRPFPSCGGVSLLCKLKENYGHGPTPSSASTMLSGSMSMDMSMMPTEKPMMPGDMAMMPTDMSLMPVPPMFYPVPNSTVFFGVVAVNVSSVWSMPGFFVCA